MDNDHNLYEFDEVSGSKFVDSIAGALRVLIGSRFNDEKFRQRFAESLKRFRVELDESIANGDEFSDALANFIEDFLELLEEFPEGEAEK